MTATYTPGPWSVTPGHSVLSIDAGNRPIARTSGGKYWRQFDSEEEANAHLIAAAPELLEALEAVEAEGMGNHNTRCKPWWAQVRAAIAKARGQA